MSLEDETIEQVLLKNNYVVMCKFKDPPSVYLKCYNNDGYTLYVYNNLNLNYTPSNTDITLINSNESFTQLAYKKGTYNEIGHQVYGTCYEITTENGSFLTIVHNDSHTFTPVERNYIINVNSTTTPLTNTNVMPYPIVMISDIINNNTNTSWKITYNTTNFRNTQLEDIVINMSKLIEKIDDIKVKIDHIDNKTSDIIAHNSSVYQIYNKLHNTKHYTVDIQTDQRIRNDNKINLLRVLNKVLSISDNIDKSLIILDEANEFLTSNYSVLSKVYN